MTSGGARGPLRHPALAVAAGGRLDREELSGHRRVGVLLQGAALLSHLQFAGWRLKNGWTGLVVDGAGLLAGAEISSGSDPVSVQERLTGLLERLFGADPGANGRGQAKRLAARLAERWRQRLAAESPDRAVREILDCAGFLWHERYGEVRARLAAGHAGEGRFELRVAGPPAWSRALVRGCATREELCGRLRSAFALRSWRELLGPHDGGLDAARRRFAECDFEVALAVSRSLPGAEGRRLRLASLVELGRFDRARGELAALARQELSAEELLVVAPAAIAACARLGEPRRAIDWSERLSRAAGGRWRSRVSLAAAAAASADRDPVAVGRLLERAGGSPTSLAGTRLEAAAAGMAGRVADAVACLGRYLLSHRRRLSRREALALWADLAQLRLAAGDQAGAARALRHCHRLAGGRPEVERAAWALEELTALALRGGRSPAPRGLLEAASARRRRAGDWHGWARCEGLRAAAERQAGEAPVARDRERAVRTELERRGLEPAAGQAAPMMGAQPDAPAPAGETRWSLLGRYLEEGRRGGRALSRLLRDCGYAAARVSWRREGRELLVSGGAGGPEKDSARVAGGRLTLSAPSIDPILRTLFLIAARVFRPPLPPPRRPPGGSRIVGEDPAWIVALRRVEKLAPSALPVVILGETGTGKELVARYTHASSRRPNGPFVAVNCAALPASLLQAELFGHARGAFTGAVSEREGVFEAASGGTLFLDEIGDLPPDAQASLLRALQEGEVRRVGESFVRQVDTRIVAATHRDLEEWTNRGRFRQDLFYRLRVGTVELPPLRERLGDLPLLCEHFLARADEALGLELSRNAWRRIYAHPWPGNVRELESCLTVAAALTEDGVIRSRHLQLARPERNLEGSYHHRLREFRKRIVGEALAAAKGSQAAAARRLGLSRQALSYLVRRLDLQ